MGQNLPLKISVTSEKCTAISCDILAIPVRASELKCSGDRSPALSAADEALSGNLISAAVSEEFSGKPESVFTMHALGKLQASRVVLFGSGVGSDEMRMSCGKIAKLASKTSAETIALAVPAFMAERQLRAMAEGLLLGHYKFSDYKSGRAGQPSSLKEAVLCLPEGMTQEAAEAILQSARSMAEAVNFARRLVDIPSNEMTPSALADAAKTMASSAGLGAEICSGESEIGAKNLGLFQAVARGSREVPHLIHLSWIPEDAEAAKKPPVVFVGKAITFDAGGLSLKTTPGMVWMKTDMAGAAAVLGAMKMVAELRPDFPVHALMGACENMPGGSAYRPGDILKSHAGKFVEICDTDAEGRLVLGDMVALAADLKPAAIVDVATLTGAVAVALGLNYTGLFSDDEILCGQIMSASKRAGEAMWRLPLDEKLRSDLDSPVADVKNLGERYGGAITAALFVREFAGGFPWAHLDIAGTCRSKTEKGFMEVGATGVAVRTLSELIAGRMSKDEDVCE